MARTPDGVRAIVVRASVRPSPDRHALAPTDPGADAFYAWREEVGWSGDGNRCSSRWRVSAIRGSSRGRCCWSRRVRTRRTWCRRRWSRRSLPGHGSSRRGRPSSTCGGRSCRGSWTGPASGGNERQALQRVAARPGVPDPRRRSVDRAGDRPAGAEPAAARVRRAAAPGGHVGAGDGVGPEPQRGCREEVRVRGRGCPERGVGYDEPSGSRLGGPGADGGGASWSVT